MIDVGIISPVAVVGKGLEVNNEIIFSYIYIHVLIIPYNYVRRSLGLLSGDFVFSCLYKGRTVSSFPIARHLLYIVPLRSTLLYAELLLIAFSDS